MTSSRWRGRGGQVKMIKIQTEVDGLRGGSRDPQKGSCPIQTHSDRQKKGRGRGTKIGHFFMDVINVWSLTETKLKFFT